MMSTAIVKHDLVQAIVIEVDVVVTIERPADLQFVVAAQAHRDVEAQPVVAVRVAIMLFSVVLVAMLVAPLRSVASIVVGTVVVVVAFRAMMQFCELQQNP